MGSRNEYYVAITFLVVMFVGLVMMLTSGCSSSRAEREDEHPDRPHYALTMEELVCKHPKVYCRGRIPYVRGGIPSVIIDGQMVRFEPMQALFSINVFDVREINVLTSPSLLSRWPQSGSSAIQITTRIR